MPDQYYQPFYTQSFWDGLNKHSSCQQRALVLVDRIVQNPTAQSHFLTYENGVDLRGKRRRHMNGNFVVIYIVCEECFELHHRGKYNNCSVCPNEITNRIIFLAFDKWDDIYRKTYPAEYPTVF